MNTLQIISLCFLNVGAVSVAIVFTLITFVEFLRSKKENSKKWQKKC